MHNIQLLLNFIYCQLIEPNYMKIELKLLLIVFTCYAFPSQAWWLTHTNSPVDSSPTNDSDKTHNEWLTNRFSKLHQQLIPIVAVVDMFFSCNQARKTDQGDYKLKHLIIDMDKNTLAEKLAHCLGDDTIQSDVALNFGLFGCFHQQLAHLPKAEREQKILLVKQVMSSLSHEERKKAVTQQSIHYLK